MKQNNIIIDDEIELPATDSIYQNVIYACLRQKQLTHGADPRIIAGSFKRKNTSIAIEEIKQKLVAFHSS